MKSLIGKLVLAGILLGLFGSVSAMIAAIIIYYVASAADLFLPISFLKYSAIFSLTIGVVCTVGWYLYLLYMVKYYIKYFLESIWSDKK